MTWPLTDDEKYAARLIYADGPVRSAGWKKAWQNREDRSEGIKSFIERLMGAERAASLRV